MSLSGPHSARESPPVLVLVCGDLERRVTLENMGVAMVPVIHNPESYPQSPTWRVSNEIEDTHVHIPLFSTLTTYDHHGMLEEVIPFGGNILLVPRTLHVTDISTVMASLRRMMQPAPASELVFFRGQTYTKTLWLTKTRSFKWKGRPVSELEPRHAVSRHLTKPDLVKTTSVSPGTTIRCSVETA